MGKTLVMWASPKCKLCQQQLEEIDWKKLRGDGIEILYIDGTQWDELCDEWEINYFPTYMLFDKDQNMISRVENDEIHKLKGIWKQ